MEDYNFNVFYLCALVLYDELEKRRLIIAFSVVFSRMKEDFSNGKKQLTQQPQVIRIEREDV